MVLHTLASLAVEPRFSCVQPVIAPDDHVFLSLVQGERFPFRLLPPVTGGEERVFSMQRGLQALPAEVEMVAVHDAARPLPGPRLLREVLDVAYRHGAAVPALPVHDTIKQVNSEGRVIATLERHSLRAAQTPQVARRAWFEAALAQQAGRLSLFTDDASLLEASGFNVYISRGDPDNRKITTEDDLTWLRTRLEGRL